MGKSGHIARKIAATLASTGTPSFFVHPGEASHGDLGMITQKDVVLALSNSGETDELLMILPVIKRQGMPLIVDDRQRRTPRWRAIADVHLDVSVPAEACPLGARADRQHDGGAGHGRCARDRAARSARLHRRGFRALASGRQRSAAGCCCTSPTSCMPATECRACSADATLTEALVEMTRKGLGMTAIVDDANACSACSPTATCAARSTTTTIDLRTTPDRRRDDRARRRRSAATRSRSKRRG